MTQNATTPAERAACIAELARLWEASPEPRECLERFVWLLGCEKPGGWQDDRDLLPGAWALVAESAGPVPGEPVEPRTDAEVLRGRLEVTTDWDECLSIIAEALAIAHDRGQSNATAARERKRGERPANPYHWPFPSDHDVRWQQGFDAGVAWCSSGDSDELARLRAELAAQAEVIAVSRGVATRLIECQDERDTEKARADRAEAEETAAKRLFSITHSDLTQAKARIAELEAMLDRCQSALQDDIAGLTRELAEAREELRLLRDFATEFGKQPGNCFARVLAAYNRHGDWADDRRAKASAAQSPSGVDSVVPGKGVFTALRDAGFEMTPAVPPHETAPTLEKGVKYRVVESSDESLSRVGQELVATGAEWQGDWTDGWYALGGTHRVVRVESATTGERAAAARQAIELDALNAGPRCEHRDWLPDDDVFATTGPECGKPATHVRCDPIGQPVCAAHKCRCNKPVATAPEITSHRESFATAREFAELARRMDILEVFARISDPEGLDRARLDVRSPEEIPAERAGKEKP